MVGFTRPPEGHVQSRRAGPDCRKLDNRLKTFALKKI